MYKEYAVYQPLQRRGVLDAESIERLRTNYMKKKIRMHMYSVI